MKRGPGSRYILGAAPGFRQYVQNIPYLDGAFTRNIPLGNRSVSFTITAEYEFATEAEAFLFGVSVPKLCPGNGVLRLGSRGATRAEYVYPGCVVESVQPIGDVVGVSLRLAYNVITGRPAT